MHCLASARSDAAVGWLAMIDLDEWIVPLPEDPTQVHRTSFSADLVLDSYAPFISSICAQRASVRHESIQRSGSGGPTSRTILLGLNRRRLLGNGRWNYKCIHRIEAIHSVFVHWPETFRRPVAGVSDGQRTEWLTGLPTDPLAILHARADPVSNGEPFQLDPALGEWQHEVAEHRDRLLEGYG